MESSEAPEEESVSPAQPDAPVPVPEPGSTPAPASKKMTLGAKLEQKAQAAKEHITTITTPTVEEISNVLVQHFGPVFVKYTEHCIPDIKTQQHLYAELGARFSESIKIFMEEKAGQNPNV